MPRAAAATKEATPAPPTILAEALPTGVLDETRCPPGWFAVEDEDSPAPISGRPVWLTNGLYGDTAEGYWRNSRRRSRSNGRWEQYGYWALVNGAGAPIPFTPNYWRPSNALIA